MIEQATYMESGHIQAVIDGVPVVVPDDLMNRERRKIAAWERAGNTIAAYVPEEVPLTGTERILFEMATGQRAVNAQMTEEDFKAELRHVERDDVSIEKPDVSLPTKR